MVDAQHEEMVTHQSESLNSPLALLDEEEQLLAQEILLEETAVVVDEKCCSSQTIFTTEMEPSIEMAEDLKEPGNDDGRIGGDSSRSGTEINTSDGIVVVQQQEHEQLMSDVAEDLSIRQESEAAAVASGSECRPVETCDLSAIPSSSSVANNNSSNREIQQENIKHALHEIISEIDREMEADLSNEEVSWIFCLSLLQRQCNVWALGKRVRLSLFVVSRFVFSFPATDVETHAPSSSSCPILSSLSKPKPSDFFAWK